MMTRTLIAVFCGNVVVLLALVMAFDAPPTGDPATRNPGNADPAGRAPLDPSQEGATAANFRAALTAVTNAGTAPGSDDVAAGVQLPPRKMLDALQAQERANTQLATPLRERLAVSVDRRAEFSRVYVPAERRAMPKVEVKLDPATSAAGAVDRLTGTLSISHYVWRSGEYSHTEEYAVVVTAEQIFVGPDAIPAAEWLQSLDQRLFIAPR